MRKAIAIELIDASVMMCTKEYNGEILSFAQPVFTVYGQDIVRLALALGLNITEGAVVGSYFDQQKRRRRALLAEDIEFRVHRGDAAEWDCVTLEAEPQGADLLTFRVGVEQDAGGPPSEYTYSGRYIIVWALG